MRKFLLGVLQKMYARRDARIAAAGGTFELPPAGKARSVEDLLAEGEQLEQSGNFDAALQRYREAIHAAPASVQAQLWAGNALMALGRLPEAEAHYRHAIELDAAYAPARLNLGNVLLATGRAEDAEAAYRVAIRLRANWPEAWAGLGCALEESAQAQPAIDAYREALRLDPAHAGAAFNLAGMLAERDPAAARAVLEDALRRNPNDATLTDALANLHRTLASPHEALALYRQLLAARPDDDAAAANVLFTLNFLPESTAESLLAEHRQWGERIAARVPAARVRTAPDPARRLRIGYVSPDFRRHAVAKFVMPLFAHHDPAQVEVFCYSNVERPDEVTGRLRELAPQWREIRGVDDAAVARQVEEDRIDILVDLAGHTAGNRLGVFARKPAPVQMTWLGYIGTTGLPAMDYRICDRHTDPPGLAERWQTETPLRLPHTYLAYQAGIELPPATQLPHAVRGHFTFGSFNQLAKLNEPLLEAWAELLASVPGSRLRLAGLPGAHWPAHLAAVLERRGVARERIETIGRAAESEYLKGYAEVDVALDSFPYCGATTTCDTLAMGVPVATVAGRRPLERSSVTLLEAVGLRDWIAPSLAELPALVRRQIADPAGLARLRAELPARMRASPLMDAPRFARDLEALYREAWKKWCAAN